jgi:site-specific recombinase XerD
VLESIKIEAPPGTSLKSLTRGYLLTHQTEGSSPHTVEYYRGILDRFLWYADKKGWADNARLLDEWHIREFLGYVGTELNRWAKVGNGSESSTRKASAGTVHHYYSSLRAFFDWAVEEDFVAENPMVRVKVAKSRPKVVVPFSSDEIRRMLAICDYDYERDAKLLGSRNRAIILILLDTGIRLSELTGMKLNDMNTETGYIRILGKGSKERVVRMGKATRKALWRYLICRTHSDTQELWLTEEGKPLRNSGVHSMVKRLKGRAGINSSGNVHRFRHTFALSFLRTDKNVFNLQYLLGHSDLDMVRRYTRALGTEDAPQAHEKASPADLLGVS